MDNLIVIGILLILVGAAIFYIWKERKKGTRCIGCPSSGCCCGKKSGNAKEMVLQCLKENGCRMKGG